MRKGLINVNKLQRILSVLLAAMMIFACMPLAAAEEPELSYLTFIEIRNAIEELGGIAPEREFDDDPTYSALFGVD